MDGARRRAARAGDRRGGPAHPVRAQATTDPLTGLANHRTFHERLRTEAARSRRSGAPLGLVLLDIDRFKLVNDSHGHQCGDEVLRIVAGLLADDARGTDVAARLGGEEFALLLSDTDEEGALAVAERLRATIAAAPVPGPGRVTASFGVAALTADGDADELVRAADRALYTPPRAPAATAASSTTTTWSGWSRARRRDRARDRAGARPARARPLGRGRGPGAAGHGERVAELASAIATGIGWEPRDVMRLRDAAIVHDVPHELVAEVLAGDQLDWVRLHGARWDGARRAGGTPEGDAIPEGARIIAIADAWDMFRGAAPGARPPSVADTLRRVRRRSGRHHWPAGVEALARLVEVGALPRTAIPHVRQSRGLTDPPPLDSGRVPFIAQLVDKAVQNTGSHRRYGRNPSRTVELRRHPSGERRDSSPQQGLPGHLGRHVPPHQRAGRRGHVAELAVAQRQPGRSIHSGTGLMVCAVFGDPSGSIRNSLLPWSAVTTSSRRRRRTAGRIRAMHASTVSIARTAAGTDPVCPTMSAFAKFTTSSSCPPVRQATHHRVAHPGGAHLRSVVVGGDVLRRLHQHAVLAVERLLPPPLKKNVTWAYFSVSAMCNCRRPAALTPPPGPAARRRPRTPPAGPTRGCTGSGTPGAAARGGAPVEAVERRVGERLRELPGPVGAEVHEDHASPSARGPSRGRPRRSPPGTRPLMPRS